MDTTTTQSVRVGSGTKVHAAHVTGTRTVRRFGRDEQVVEYGLPLCGCSIWTKRGGYGSVAAVTAPINCERCLAALAR